VLASLRSADQARLADEIAQLEAAGIDGLHLDVMDGHLVPDLCFGPSVVAAVRKSTRLPIDVHLLVAAPARFIETLAKAGADRITVHVESLASPAAVAELLDRIHALGCRAGVACFPPTSIDALAVHLAQAEVVNPLAVDPRVQGPAAGFHDCAYERLQWLAQQKARSSSHAVLQADGGVWEQTREGLVAAGAEELIAGFPIFSATDRAAAVAALRGRQAE
jgi:ribulose-phosphate 3-epimerase